VFSISSHDPLTNAPLSLRLAPWCGHCKRLEPEWTKAAKKLAKVKGVHLGTVDGTVHEALKTQYGIDGYPTIKVFGKDKATPMQVGLITLAPLNLSIISLAFPLLTHHSRLLYFIVVVVADPLLTLAFFPRLVAVRRRQRRKGHCGGSEGVR
jgi:thiol-disulfide isomerase/thioredoxin